MTENVEALYERLKMSAVLHTLFLSNGFCNTCQLSKKSRISKKVRVRLATSAASSSFISFQIQSMLAHMKMPPKTSFHSILSTLEKKPKKLSAKGTSKHQQNLLLLVVVVCKRSWLQSDVLDWNSNKAETPFIKRSAKCITMPLRLTCSSTFTSYKGSHLSYSKLQFAEANFEVSRPFLPKLTLFQKLYTWYLCNDKSKLHRLQKKNLIKNMIRL